MTRQTYTFWECDFDTTHCNPVFACRVAAGFLFIGEECWSHAAFTRSLPRSRADPTEMQLALAQMLFALEGTAPTIIRLNNLKIGESLCREEYGTHSFSWDAFRLPVV
jgi:hypothetical protein